MLVYGPSKARLASVAISVAFRCGPALIESRVCELRAADRARRTRSEALLRQRSGAGCRVPLLRPEGGAAALRERIREKPERRPRRGLRYGTRDQARSPSHRPPTRSELGHSFKRGRRRSAARSAIRPGLFDPIRAMTKEETWTT